MKTYLLDTFNRYKRWSEQLDVNTILCDKAWEIFNDSGQKELYIFQRDGSLMITLAGKVSYGTWKYVPANQSIVIESSGQGYMLHPVFMDEVILALQVDGTKEYAFMIDEKNKQSFAPKSLQALQNYFEQKRIIQLEQEKRIEEERENALIAQQEEEEERRKIEEENKRKAEVEKLRASIPKFHSCLTLISLFLAYAISATITMSSYINKSNAGTVLGFLLLCACVIYTILWGRIEDYFDKREIEQWKIEHPNDWRAKYL